MTKEVSHAQDQATREADRTGVFDSEGQLSCETGRDAGRRGRSQCGYRLKRSIDLFRSNDGALYLLRSAHHEEFVVEAPSEADLILLTALAGDFRTQSALERLLCSRNLDPTDLVATLLTLEKHGLLDRQPDGS